MLTNLKFDFKRIYSRTTYKGKLKKFLVCFCAQGFQAIMAYRICRWLISKHIPIIHLFIQRWTEITTGISIPAEVKIGRGLMIPHFGGIIVNSEAELGEFCTISHGVTIGNKKPGGKSPKIGNNVFICAGAKVLGDITIGNNSIIGANAVVLDSIPPNSVVAGIPAKVVKSIDGQSEFESFFYKDED